MTWFHLVIANGQHIIFPLSAIVLIAANVTDGSQDVFMTLTDGSQYRLTTAQVLKIVGTIPAAL